MAKVSGLSPEQISILLFCINTQQGVYQRAVRATPDKDMAAVIQKRTAELLAVRDLLQYGQESIK